MNYDIIISGAGPAGSFTAYNLALNGFKVLIIDKAEFPRYKVCGGGLPFRAKQLLQMDLSSILGSDIYSFQFSHLYSHIYKRTTDKLLIQCFMRNDLDNFLLINAVNAGAEIKQSEKVKEIIENNNGVKVRTTNSEYTARMVIGADGANSIVAKSLNLMQKNVSKAYAIEGEIFVDDKVYEQYKETIALDWGTLTNGYGWVFPKKDHLSVGVGGPFSLSKQIKTYYETLIQKFDLKVKETKSLQGHTIPFRQNNSKIFTDYSLLVGDAAGLTDPLTGEGIYYALKSGKLAADVVTEFLNGNIKDLSLYQAKVNEVIMPELNAALPVLYVFNLAPLYFHNYLRDSDRLWNAFCRIIRGELSYNVIKSKLPASSVIWNPLVNTSKFINLIKTKQLFKN